MVNPRTGWRVLRHRGFALFVVGRMLMTFGTQIIGVAVGWQVYDLTRNPADLGLVGLFQFAPALLLILVTGAVSDRYNRRAIAAVCLFGQGMAAALLFILTWSGNINVSIVFLLIFFFGIGRAFVNPATNSLLPNLVPQHEIANAIAFGSSSWQIGVVVGPAIGGLLYGVAAEAAYGAAVACFVFAAVCMGAIAKPAQKTTVEPPSWTSMVAGIRFIWSERIVLGAVSLDLFAVLLGGAVALLPAYARDILDVGPWGLGLLRSANGVGSLVMGLCLTTWPIRDRAGAIMLTAAAFFGIFTVVFAISTIVWLSILMLLFMGAMDMVSVYVRETLIQLRTPDDVRGRVNAVSMTFTAASNEIGAFRAGMIAALIGVMPAVVIGGVGTIAVAGLWAVWFPELRRARRLNDFT